MIPSSQGLDTGSQLTDAQIMQVSDGKILQFSYYMSLTSLHSRHFNFTSRLLHFSSLHFSSLVFTCLYFTLLHFTSLHLSLLVFTCPYLSLLVFTLLYFTLLHFSSLLFTSLYFSLLLFTSLYFSLLYFTSTSFHFNFTSPSFHFNFTSPSFTFMKSPIIHVFLCSSGQRNNQCPDQRGSRDYCECVRRWSGD